MQTKLIAMLTIASSLLWSGCMPVMYQQHYEPQTATVHLNVTPDVAFQRAYKAMATMGGRITVHDPIQRVLSAEVHNAVIMHVVVEPSQVIVTGSVMTNKMVTGEFDEVSQYISLLQAL